MDDATAADRRRASLETTGSFDHVSTQEQMQAIGAAFQMYFNSDDWLAERDRSFRGLSRRTNHEGQPEQVYGEGQ